MSPRVDIPPSPALRAASSRSAPPRSLRRAIMAAALVAAITALSSARAIPQSLLVPDLVSPPDSSSVDPPSVTLRWEPVVSASSYRIQLSRDPGFAGLHLDTGGVTQATVVAGEVMAGGRYHWRVRATTGIVEQTWSEVWTFTVRIPPPAAPDLLAPADGVDSVRMPVLLRWDPVPGAERYRVQATPRAEGRVVDDSTVPGAERLVDSLTPGMRYDWRVRALNAGGAGPWSSSRTFTTAAPPVTVGSPRPVSPPDGATGVSARPVLRWTSVIGATSYTLHLSTDPGFGGAVLSVDGTADTSATAPELEHGTTYHWRVRAATAGVQGAWSGRSSFTTIHPAPPAPTPASPADGATGVSRPVPFAWSAVAGADRYHLQVAATTGFIAPVVDDDSVSVPAHTADMLEADRQYFWRVRARASGQWGGFSAARTFTTAPETASPPPAPTPLVPADGADSQPPSIRFRWSAAPGASRYRLQVSTTPGFSPPFVDLEELNDTAATVEGLSEGTRYSWRVRAGNTGGAGPWSSSRTFTTAAESTSGPGLLTLRATIDFPERARPSEYAPEDYRLVGLPGAGGLPAARLLAGPPGVDWLMVRDRGTPSGYFVPYDGSADFAFSPGRGFWLLRRGPWRIDTVVPAAPLEPGGVAHIPVHPGWNIISNPNESPIPWSLVQEENLLSGPIFGYAGGFASEEEFAPFAAYYYYNGDGRSVLRIPATGERRQRASARPMSAGIEWMVRIDLISGNSRDRSARFGVSPGASPGLDPGDDRRPRTPGGSEPGIFFLRPEWDSVNAAFAADVRAEVGALCVWPVTVRTAGDAGSTLMFAGISGIPEEYGVYFIDDASRVVIDLRTDSSIMLSAYPRRRSGRIVVGRSEAVGVLLRGVPSAWAPELGDPYPNPFNPATVIPIALPAESEIDLTLYDVLGRPVRALHSGRLPKGRHDIFWDGKDDRGREVSAGVYFPRLSVRGGMHQSKKIVRTE